MQPIATIHMRHSIVSPIPGTPGGWRRPAGPLLDFQVRRGPAARGDQPLGLLLLCLLCYGLFRAEDWGRAAEPSSSAALHCLEGLQRDLPVLILIQQVPEV